MWMINLEQKITSIPDKTKGKLTEIKSNQNEKELKGNCCIVVENINFFMEECGVELVQDEWFDL